MTKIISVRQVFILTVIITILVSLAVICDNDDASFDFVYDTGCICRYHEFLPGPSLCSWVTYSEDHPASSKQFILYVERQEKSPPYQPAEQSFQV